MSYKTKKLNDSELEFTITVTPADYAKHLKTAAEKISHRTAVKGFRKGNVPYDIIKKEVGEMAILQEALESVVKETFYNAVKQEELETVGMPKIDIEKLAPGNDIEYKAVVGLMPKVELPDISKLKVKHTVKPLDDAKMNETLDAIRGMNATEVPKDGVAEGTDKLLLDMEMFIDRVPVEGGQAKEHQVYLSENHYIPGFNEQVKGLKKGDEKEFNLDFPDTHYQKHLAGKKVEFKVKVKNVFERQLPELSDELAKKLGQESVEKLKELLRTNMEAEALQKADQKAEIEALDIIIEKSKFDQIPKVIIDAEKQKMFYELKADLDKHGISLENYLQDIKKKEDELYKEFTSQAEKRAKAALVSRQIAIDQKITISDEELEAEIKMMRDVYKDDKEILEKLKSPGVKETIATSLQNKKVIAFIKEKIVEKV